MFSWKRYSMSYCLVCFMLYWLIDTLNAKLIKILYVVLISVFNSKWLIHIFNIFSSVLYWMLYWFILIFSFLFKVVLNYWEYFRIYFPIFLIDWLIGIFMMIILMCRRCTPSGLRRRFWGGRWGEGSPSRHQHYPPLPGR